MSGDRPLRAGAAKPHPPLIVSDDPDLLDDLMRLAAAAGAEPRVATTVDGARAAWAQAGMVVVGSDRSADLAAAHVPRRPGVVLVHSGPADPAIWQVAVRIGAEQVCLLPESETDLVERFADSVDLPDARGHVVCLIGGRGGAGASTLAVALAYTAAERGGEPFLIDLDPLGPGIDVLLSPHELPGLHWPDLGRTRGRVSAAALAAGSPVVDGVRVLTWGHEPADPPWPGAAGAVIDAARRASDFVVVDLPRSFGDACSEALTRATITLLVVPCDPWSAAAAARIAVNPLLPPESLRLVVRGPARADVSADDIAQALGIPLALSMPAQPGLERDFAAGRLPGSRGRTPLAAACARLLEMSGEFVGAA